ncbi:hypothetical protein [Faecalibacillus faecis]|uniref:hypothetical protein n=1 Tax=Faecalibacillus faecis TaxID=1982628 RepID=UPI0018A91AE3|nr:hypothetical protein [Faecalibacillus faecis]
MLNELDKLFDMLLEIDDKLNELQRVNSLVIVTCDACENGNDIKDDIANVMVFIQDQIDLVDDDIRSNISKCNDILKSMQGTIQKGGCQYERTTNI